jgi:DNA polymerase III subunit epsilon
MSEMPNDKLKPLAFIDVESTGPDPGTDAIFSVGMFGFPPYLFDKEWLCKPWKPIPPEIEKLTGTTNEMVANCPPFKAFAAEIHSLLSLYDLGGFNCRQFDVPILWEELFRSKIEWDLRNTLVIDAGTLFKLREERTLSAAMMFYCGKEHTGAHRALDDSRATAEVFAAQLQRYPDLQSLDRAALAKATEYDGPIRASLDGKIRYNEYGDAIYGFGKHEGQKVKDHRDYAQWMLTKDFPEHTKMVLRTLLGEYARQQNRTATQRKLL